MNKLFLNLTAFSLLAVMSGCATGPTGPTVQVMPRPGKSFDVFQAEDSRCRLWAERQESQPVHKTYQKRVATGAVAGTVGGAGVGAAFGAAAGDPAMGAAVGAASGLLLGSAIGASSGESYSQEAQRRYDNAYAQCMYSYGNKVPGYKLARVSRKK